MTYQKIDGVRSQQTLLWGRFMDAIGVNSIQPLCVPDFQFTQHADPWPDLASCFRTSCGWPVKEIAFEAPVSHLLVELPPSEVPDISRLMSERLNVDFLYLN